MRYRISYTSEAKCAIQTMLGHFRQHARRLIESLIDNPRPAETKELRGLPGYYRLRLDGWRIIYRVNDEAEIILILLVRRKPAPESYQDLI